VQADQQQQQQHFSLPVRDSDLRFCAACCCVGWGNLRAAVQSPVLSACLQISCQRCFMPAALLHICMLPCSRQFVGSGHCNTASAARLKSGWATATPHQQPASKVAGPLQHRISSPPQHNCSRWRACQEQQLELACIQCVQRASAAVTATVQYNSSSRVHLQSNDKRLLRDLEILRLAASMFVRSEGDHTTSSEPLYIWHTDKCSTMLAVKSLSTVTLPGSNAGTSAT
jgi:hypothetical protein